MSHQGSFGLEILNDPWWPSRPGEDELPQRRVPSMKANGVGLATIRSRVNPAESSSALPS
ncbi:MAG TPA: hypothetical protein VMG38_09215 [Trebonia sp.]|nr:hypothetical protein [Trebonia sp.]